jgi:hypothetical protein
MESVRRAVLLFLFCLYPLCGPVYADFETDVIDLVNAERSAHGLHSLNYDANLASAARDHSEDMGVQDYFSHTGLDGRTAADRITAAGYSYSTFGENIAGGYATPQAAVDAWMSSAGHRANILNSNFCDIGVGYMYVSNSTYGHYWTQDFGRKSGLTSCPGISTYTITANAGPGGSISPEGSLAVNQGSTLTFTFTPDSGYGVAEVWVDGEAKSITTSYTFTNVSSDHTIAVNFAINQSPPIADAGLPQNLAEGETVTLDASLSADPNDAVVAYAWSQIAGPRVTLSDENAVKPTFVAAPITEDTTLVFQVTVYDTGGSSDSDTVEVAITENGIQNFPDDFIAFYTNTGRVMGIKPDSDSALVSLHPIDPASSSFSGRNGMPAEMIYGLIEFCIKVARPGNSARLTVFLPEPVPDGYKWYKYGRTRGWYDYSANASFNSDRHQLGLILVDGGTGDDDGDQNGMIADPSGLGVVVSHPAATDTGGGGGSGGCWIDTAGHDLNWKRCLNRLRIIGYFLFFGLVLNFINTITYKKLTTARRARGELITLKN